MTIDSKENKKYKLWKSLKEKKYRDIENMFLIEGDHLVEEAYKTKKLKELILLNGSTQNYVGVETYYVSEGMMKELTSFKSIPNIIGICEKQNLKNTNPNKIILLDNVQDPGNVGTILRSGVAFDFDTIIIGTNTCDVYNPKVVSASQGAIFKMDIIENNTIEEIKKLKTKNIKIYGTDVNNGINTKTLDNKNNICIIVGNEGNGLDDDVLSLCDERLNILTSTNTESLNVGVAASIIMYQLSDL